jgi:hypothetical protein
MSTIIIITGSTTKAEALAEKLCPRSWAKHVEIVREGVYRVWKSGHQYAAHRREIKDRIARGDRS